MAKMEFLGQNLIGTTTQILVDVNTNLTEYLIDRNKKLTYQTTGYSSNTSSIISIEFDSPTIISNVILQNHNFKQFRLFYNSVTANSLQTYANNSDTSTYLFINSVTVSSLQLQIDTAFTTDTEKYLGQFVIAERELVFERNPDIKDYKPNIDRYQIKHVMADGGTTLHNIRDKYKVKLGFDFIEESFHDDLYSIFETGNPLYYVPFPTTTAWAGQAFEMVWVGDFNFKYATNVRAIGYSGDIALEETSGR